MKNEIIEIWKDVQDFPQKYEISNKGRLRNKTTNHIYKQTNKKGVCKRNILQCINHQEGRKQAGNYIWQCEKGVMNNG